MKKVPFWFTSFLSWKLILVSLFLGLFFSNKTYYNPPSFNLYKDMDYWGQAFMRWDGQVYLTIAKGWYDSKVTDASAFYPLFPFLIRTLAQFGIDYFYSAFILVILFGAGLFYYLYRYSSSKKMILIFLAYPPAFYLNAIYTEVLFLFLLFGLLDSMYREKRLLIAVFSFLLVFTRGQGFFVAAAVGVYYFVKVFSRERMRDESPVPLASVTLALGCFTLGTVSFLVFQWLQVGHPFGAFQAQKFFAFNNSILNIFKPMNFLEFMTDGNLKVFDFLKSLNDRFFILLNFGLILIFRKKLKMVEFLLAASLAILPAIMGQGGSYIRFSLLSFPLISLAISRSQLPTKKVIFNSLIVLSCTWQLILIARFVTNLWVA